ncbi:hypothetical protein MPC4_110008 [Methylocella tundrae]|uniref:Uncharacterized protein n=1 Tax=Methylocella tundrae TaxID=227605 RepID=A0A8B6M1J9_METTU|nr:hypothetical protein MPC1_3540002 [Methylocella tundrae]VTZ48708.1 hypothetical protein MPC4_110008 [Methylocella tundrae]
MSYGDGSGAALRMMVSVIGQWGSHETEHYRGL